MPCGLSAVLSCSALADLGPHPRRDRAHLTIVFTALAVSRTVQNQTGLSLRRVLRTFEPLRSATVEINGVTTTIPPALSPAEAAILNAMQAPTARH
jgi:hypothetical protein